MREIQINYDNILNPNDAFRDYLKRLMPIYIEDYGVEHAKLIKERINKAVYIFDSLPVDEVNFIAEYGSKLQCPQKARLAYDECSDFFRKKKRISERIDKKFYKIIAEAFGAGERNIDELFTIDIDSYSLGNQLALGAADVLDEYKDEIRRRQEGYRKDCERLNVKCITDYRVIDRLFEIRDDVDYETNLLLAKDTKWVKRIKKRIFDECGAVLTDEQLVDLLFYCKTATSNVVDVGRCEKLIICYFPLAKNIMIGNVDRSFFHENRHVVELADGYSGLQVFNSCKYLSINEVRTEKNAIHDSDNLVEFPLFSNSGFVNNNWNVYEEMFPYTEGFFDEHREVLNRFAVRNAVKDFERLYGRKNLKCFEDYLRNVQDAFMNDTWMLQQIYDEEKQKSLVRKLNEHYQSRH